MFAYGEYTIKYLIEKTERTRKVREQELSLAMEQLSIKEKSEKDLKQERENLQTQLKLKKKRKNIRYNSIKKSLLVKRPNVKLFESTSL